jgi:FkbM family methyltransferase
MTAAILPDLSFPERPEETLTAARERGVWIFGCGQFARALRHALESLAVPIKGFLTSAGFATVVDGVAVTPISDVVLSGDRDEVWIGVFNHHPNANLEKIFKLCRSVGFTRVLLPTQYYEAVAEEMGWRYWLTRRGDYQAHAAELATALSVMADEQSRDLFMSLLAYRLGRLREIPAAPVADLHYFPSFMVESVAQRGRPVSLVDGGAYDGDTISTALLNIPLESAFAFEPDLKNYTALTRRASTLAIPITCIPCGLSSETRSIRFASGHGEASAISATGDEVIQVVSLDECLPQTRVDYIKLDVEGHEMPALRGAIQTIRRHRPALAIAGYHRASDLWSIPNFIADLDLGYSIRLRIHTENSFETVFYAV